jgi:2-dehydropantoate 2-reductase
VVVFGAGALGSLLGGKLSRVVPVALIGRPAHMEAIRSRGLRISGLSDETVRCGERLAACVSLDELRPALRAGELVLLTVKAARTEPAGRTLAAAAPAAGLNVVAFQNGTGFEEPLRAALGDRCALFFAVSHLGATLRAPGRVEDWGGEILLPDVEKMRGPEAALQAAGLAVRRAPDIERRRWEKIAFNCALNVFCVLLEARNNETLDPRFRPIRRRVLAEARAEAERAGAGLAPTAELLDEFERRVAVSRNVNSMLQDFRRGVRSENAYLNGALARLARQHSTRAPANAALAGWMARLERARLPEQQAALRAAALADLRSARWEELAG